jgi:hypothetical protein
VKAPDPFVLALNVIRIYSDELAKRGVKEEILIAALVTGARVAEFRPADRSTAVTAAGADF